MGSNILHAANAYIMFSMLCVPCVFGRVLLLKSSVKKKKRSRAEKCFSFLETTIIKQKLVLAVSGYLQIYDLTKHN